MSFQESDISNILKVLTFINKNYNHPGLSKKIIEEADKNYKTIPVYPGIVADTLSKMIVKTKNTDLKKNDWIAFEFNNIKYAGRIKSIFKDQILFYQIIEISNKKSVKFNKQKIKNIIKVNENQLEKDWPMLIFKGD